LLSYDKTASFATTSLK